MKEVKVMAKSPISHYTFYDPENFRIIVEKGQEINAEAGERLKQLGLYDVAVKAPDMSVTKQGVKIGIGRKKSALAEVRMKAGRGKIEVTVNGKPLERGFEQILQVFEIAGLNESEWDLQGEVNGSPNSTRNQIRALQHAVAGAIAKWHPEKSQILRNNGFRWR